MTTVVTVPQENPNDDEVLFVQWSALDGAAVRRGEPICELETTKSTFDVEAPADGFLRHMAEVGTNVPIGAVIAAITDTADEPLPDPTVLQPIEPEPAAGGTGATLTKKAQIVARRLNVDTNKVVAWKKTGIITEADVEAFAKTDAPSPVALTAEQTGVNVTTNHVTKDESAQRLLVIGGGNACVQIIDVTSRLSSITAVGVVDDTPEKQGTDVLGVPILGPIADIEKLWKGKAFDGVCISISNIKFRTKTFTQLKALGIPFINVIDPQAHVGSGVQLGEGNFISALARLGPLVKVGNNNFLSSYVSLDHHNVLGSHCTFGPGVMASGTVTIDDGVLFGTGVFIEPGHTIGNKAVIASGAVIRHDVAESAVVKVKQGEIARNS